MILFRLTDMRFTQILLEISSSALNVANLAESVNHDIGIDVAERSRHSILRVLVVAFLLPKAYPFYPKLLEFSTFALHIADLAGSDAMAVVLQIDVVI